MSMSERIATCAQLLEEVLTKDRELNILRLPERMGERGVIAYQALGWLACRRRVSYRQRGNQVFVSLTRTAAISDDR